MRTALTRNGGSMADPGSVSYLFNRKGVVIVNKAAGVTEDDVLAAVLDSGAEEVNDLGESFEVVSEAHDLVAVRQALQDAGIDYESAEAAFLPSVRGAAGRGARQEGVPADRGRRGLRRRAGRLRELLGARRRDGEARLTRGHPPAGTQDDLEFEVDLSRRAFGPLDEATRPRLLDEVGAAAADGRYYAAFDGPRPVAAAAFHDMRQWWHGRAVRMAGVGGVKVAPERRGRGTGRALMTELLRVIAGRGYPLSVLYPATAPLYRSLGWELGGGLYRAVIAGRSLASLLPPDGPAPPLPGPPGLRRAGAGDAGEVIDSHRRRARVGPALRPGHLRRGHGPALVAGATRTSSATWRPTASSPMAGTRSTARCRSGWRSPGRRRRRGPCGRPWARMPRWPARSARW